MNNIEHRKEIRRKEIKEALAKLMATENIIVQHAPVPTAAFNLVERKLILPNWQNISEDVYSLLISHEVGHALYTPTEDWKTAIESVDKDKQKSYKSVVNIVEDVRIEKAIQAKYPGSVRSFRAGYSELEEVNLFGTRDEQGNVKDLSKYNILDRLNIHFKVGTFGYAKVPFAPNEQRFVDALSNTRNFDDVLEVSKELLKYAEEEKEAKGDQLEYAGGEGGLDGDVDTETIEVGSEEEARELAKKLSKQAKAGKGNGKRIKIKYPNGDGTFSEIEIDGNGDEASSGPLGSRGDGSGITSATQDHFDKRMREYIDLTNNTLYLNIEKYDLKKVIVDYKHILVQFRDYYNNYAASKIARAEESLANFKYNNKHIVNQLVNIFEMKKRAKADLRALVSKTGVLDTNKVHSYRYNEDIFRKITTIPNGKSHGLIMFIDMSGSMAGNMPGTIAQTLNLVMFCKRVNIPFEVYGFSDVEASKSGLGMGGTKNMIGGKSVNDVVLPGNFSLRNYFSSKMSHLEYNEMMLYMMCVIMNYSRSRDEHISIPNSEGLGGTPLNEAILCSMQIVPEFKERNKLDIVNTVLLTDGDGTSGFIYNKGTNSIGEVGNSYGSATNQHIYMRHYSSRKTYVLSTAYKGRSSARYNYGTRDTTANLLDMYRDITGTKMIGFYITNKEYGESTIRYMTNSDTKEQEKQLKNWEQYHYGEIKADGYDMYYVVPQGDDLLTVTEDLGLGSAKQQRTIQRKFIEAMKAKKVSRIMLNRFVDNIA